MPRNCHHHNNCLSITDFQWIRSGIAFTALEHKKNQLQEELAAVYKATNEKTQSLLDVIIKREKEYAAIIITTTKQHQQSRSSSLHNMIVTIVIIRTIIFTITTTSLPSLITYHRYDHHYHLHITSYHHFHRSATCCDTCDSVEHWKQKSAEKELMAEGFQTGLRQASNEITVLHTKINDLTVHIHIKHQHHPHHQ